MTIRVELGPRSYDIAVGSHAPGFASFVTNRVPSRRAFIVTDTNLLNLAQTLAADLKPLMAACNLATVPAGESSKSLEQAARLYEQLALFPADRQTAIIAVGGGVVGDLAGFVAATYSRGLPLIMVPTSLLAMVDSSVGGKVGINLPEGKNLVGAFHQPAGVWIDTSYLDTLPDREFRSGLAEVVKYGIILDADFFGWLESHAGAVGRRDAAALQHIVTRSCEIKARVVEQDEREEKGLRAALNFGHTFGHAFETVGGYGRWLHGEAVAAGMVCASRLAERRGWIGTETTQRLSALLQEFQLPVAPPAGQVDDWLAVMRRDKKAVGGRYRFVLPRRLGAVAVDDETPEADIRAVLT